MNIRILTCYIVFILLLSACKKDSQPNEPSSGNFGGTTWQLVAIDTANGGTVVLNQADSIFLTFDDNRRISGKSPGLCGNTYFGVYSIPVEGSIRLDSLITTKIYCPNSQYHYYYDLLMRAEQYQRSDTRLNLHCDSKSRILVFRFIQ